MGCQRLFGHCLPSHPTFVTGRSCFFTTRFLTPSITKLLDFSISLLNIETDLVVVIPCPCKNLKFDIFLKNGLISLFCRYRIRYFYLFIHKIKCINWCINTFNQEIRIRYKILSSLKERLLTTYVTKVTRKALNF